MKRKPDKRLVDELPDVDIPAPGYGQRELAVLQKLFQPDMPDGELVNLYFLVHDWNDRSEYVFGQWLQRVEGVLIERMSGSLPSPDMIRSLPGFEPEEYTAATETVCSGDLTDWQLLEMYAIAASERADEEIGHRWQAVMDLCRTQILRRIKVTRARLTKPANDETSPPPGLTPSEMEARLAANEAYGRRIEDERRHLKMSERCLAEALCLTEADIRRTEEGSPLMDPRMILTALLRASDYFEHEDAIDFLTAKTYVAHFYEAARRMTTKVREVWFLHYAGGMTVAEIAEWQSLSKGMIGQRLREAETDVERFGPQPPKDTGRKRRGPKGW